MRAVTPAPEAAERRERRGPALAAPGGPGGPRGKGAGLGSGPARAALVLRMCGARPSPLRGAVANGRAAPSANGAALQYRVPLPRAAARQGPGAAAGAP